MRLDVKLFQPGERVLGTFDLATVRGTLPDGYVLVEWDEVDAAGWWRPGPRLTPRAPWTLTRVPQGTPMTPENEESRRYRASWGERWPGRA